MTAVMRLADAVLQANQRQQSAGNGQDAASHTRDHNEKLHQMVVDRGRRRRLDDENILVAHRLVDLHTCLTRQELGDMARRERDAQSVQAGPAEQCTSHMSSEGFDHNRGAARRVEVHRIDVALRRKRRGNKRQHAY